MKDRFLDWFITWLFPEECKIEDTIYFQSKKLYVERMRLANNFEAFVKPFAVWVCDKLTYFLEGFKKC